MRRRDLVTAAGGAWVAAAVPLAALAARGQRPTSRVRPGDRGWPSPADWAALARHVDGNLLEPQPLLAACVESTGSNACAAALAHLRNPYYVGDQAGGTQVSGWLDAWQPAPSRFAVACRESRHAVAAVEFARRRNLRLVVKGGGHSYQGTSNAPDSLLIWTRAMHGVRLHDEFVGEGCAGHAAPQHAVSIGAGAIWGHVYQEVMVKAGRYAQGGGCMTVGVAGFLNGGGFGSLSKMFGIGAASLLEAEVVTADSEIRIANACVNPDLFWALKGGGGGFGVVTRVTVGTHNLPD